MCKLREEVGASSLVALKVPKRNIKMVLERHAAELMELPGVVGVAQGEWRGKPCVKVFVMARNRDLLSRIPNTIEGYLVQVEESGNFRALDT